MKKRGTTTSVVVLFFFLPPIFAARLSSDRLHSQTTARPNIVFIVADDMGHADVAAYGGRIQTPHIDRLATEGIRFTQVYAGNTVCAPSRSTLLTGSHMGRTPVRSNTGGVSLRPEDVTIAEVLKAAGYATGGYGKWGLAEVGLPGAPEKQGFDEFFGYYHQIHAHQFYPDTSIAMASGSIFPGTPGSTTGASEESEASERSPRSTPPPAERASSATTRLSIG